MNLRAILESLKFLNSGHNQMLLILKQRSILCPQAFVLILVKYGLKLKKLFSFISFIENNLEQSFGYTLKNIEMGPVSELLRTIEFYFIVEAVEE